MFGSSYIPACTALGWDSGQCYELQYVERGPARKTTTIYVLPQDCARGYQKSDYSPAFQPENQWLGRLHAVDIIMPWADADRTCGARVFFFFPMFGNGRIGALSDRYDIYIYVPAGQDRAVCINTPSRSHFLGTFLGVCLGRPAEEYGNEGDGRGGDRPLQPVVSFLFFLFRASQFLLHSGG